MSNQGSQTKSVKDTQDPLSFQMKGQMRNLGVPFFLQMSHEERLLLKAI
jgi:hypothetical protein